MAHVRPLTPVFGLCLTTGLGAGAFDALAEETTERHRIVQAVPTAGTGNPYDPSMRLGHDATERHHFGDALTHFRGALQAKPDDRYAEQAVRNVRTYLQRCGNPMRPHWQGTAAKPLLNAAP